MNAPSASGISSPARAAKLRGHEGKRLTTSPDDEVADQCRGCADRLGAGLLPYLSVPYDIRERRPITRYIHPLPATQVDGQRPTSRVVGIGADFPRVGQGRIADRPARIDARSEDRLSTSGIWLSLLSESW